MTLVEELAYALCDLWINFLTKINCEMNYCYQSTYLSFDRVVFPSVTVHFCCFPYLVPNICRNDKDWETRCLLGRCDVPVCPGKVQIYNWQESRGQEMEGGNAADCWLSSDPPERSNCCPQTIHIWEKDPLQVWIPPGKRSLNLWCNANILENVMENGFSSVLLFVFFSVKQCEYVIIWVQSIVRLVMFFPVSREGRDSSIQCRSAECSTSQCCSWNKWEFTGQCSSWESC